MNGGAGVNPDAMTINYLTSATGARPVRTPTKPPFIPIVRPTIHQPAPSPAPTPRTVAEDLYRNPLPLSDGALIASVTSATQSDYDQNADVTPQSLLRLPTQNPEAANQFDVLCPGQDMTTGINVSHLQYWVGANQVDYSGNLWELDPAEVAPRADAGDEQFDD